MWRPCLSSTLPSLVQPRVDPEQDTWTSVKQTAVTGAVALAAKAYVSGLNSVTVFYRERLVEAVERRPSDQGLLTLCNHISALDDPIALVPLVKPRWFLDSKRIRWTLCAANRCFKNEVMSRFMEAARVIPVTRGLGVLQPGITAALARLHAGDWVHVFPEGRRSLSGDLLTTRYGVGKLIADPAVTPIVIPYVHHGMQEILPKGRTHLGLGHHLYILVGEPIDLSDILTKRFEHKRHLYREVSDRVHVHLLKLQDQLQRMIEEYERNVPRGV